MFANIANGGVDVGVDVEGYVFNGDILMKIWVNRNEYYEILLQGLHWIY